MKKFFFNGALATALLTVAVGLSACGGNSVVSDSAAKPAGGQTATQPAASPNSVTATSNVATNNAAGQQPSPSPTIVPAIKEAQAKPGVPVTVPENLKRPFTPEEMQKVMQALPPEVRARMQGMQAAPPGVKPVLPQPTPKK